MKFFQTVKLCLKGGGKYFKAFYKGFKYEHSIIRAKMIDITSIALNGCKLRKKRRV